MNKIFGAGGAAAALALTLVAGVGSAQAREPQHFQQQRTERYDPGPREMAPRRDRVAEHNRTVIINNGARYGGVWNYGGPVFVPVPVREPVAVDQCTVDNTWGQVVAQDTWPYPNMNYSFQAGCSNGTGMWNGYTFYHNTVFE